METCIMSRMKATYVKTCSRNTNKNVILHLKVRIYYVLINHYAIRGGNTLLLGNNIYSPRSKIVFECITCRLRGRT